MLREEINKDTEIGKKIITYMNDGKFVDDEIINKIIKNIIFDPKKTNVVKTPRRFEMKSPASPNLDCMK